MRGADLRGANLRGANLWGADLQNAILPDGRKFEDYLLDPLAGICSEPDAVSRALSAWGSHTWQDCPMHAAFGWNNISDAPKDKQLLVSAFIALFDAKLLPKPLK